MLSPSPSRPALRFNGAGYAYKHIHCQGLKRVVIQA